MPDLRARELWAVGPLVALIIVFGFYPQPLLNIINPAVNRTLTTVHSTDPVPPHPASSVNCPQRLTANEVACVTTTARVLGAPGGAYQSVLTVRHPRVQPTVPTTGSTP